MDIEIESELDLDYLRNQANSLKISEMKQYEKLINKYSTKEEEPRLLILKDKVFYVNKNILTDDVTFTTFPKKVSIEILRVRIMEGYKLFTSTENIQSYKPGIGSLTYAPANLPSSMSDLNGLFGAT